MDSTAPSTLLLAWIVAPLILLAVSTGWGALVELAAADSLRSLRIPVGLAAVTVVLSGSMLIGIPASGCVAVAVVGALIGIVTSARRTRATASQSERNQRRQDLIHDALTWLAAYVLLMIPLVTFGRAALLGYVFNNDPAGHLTVVELLRTTGMHQFKQPASSYEAVSRLLGDGYPIGSHMLVLVSSMLAGTRSLLVWTPLIAACGAFAALAVRAILSASQLPRWACSIGAVVAACSYLPASYFAQGSLKEILFAALIMLCATTAEFARRQEFRLRSLIPFVVGAGGAISTMGPAALFWLAPIIVVVAGIALAHPPKEVSRGRLIGAFAAAATLTVVVLIPQLLGALSFTSTNSGSEALQQNGNLLGSLNWSETLGVWLVGDYRYAPEHMKIQQALTLIAFAFAAFGFVVALRRRLLAMPLAVGASVIACIWLHFNYSAYFEGKGLVVLSVACVTAVVIGIAAAVASRPRIAAPFAGLLVIGLLASWVMIFNSVWVSPKQTFDELAGWNNRLAGKGPVLVNERSAYAMLLMRDASPTEIWSSWLPVAERYTISGGTAGVPHTPDTDDYDLSFMDRYRFILDRRNPGSRPPGNFNAVASSRHYVLWQRLGPAPRRHIPLGAEQLSGGSALQCSSPEIHALRKLPERTRLRVALAPTTVARPLSPNSAPPAGFQVGPQEGIFQRKNRNAANGGKITLARGTRYEVLVQGSFGPGFSHSVDGYPTGRQREELGTQDGWQPLGSFVAGGKASVLLRATPTSRLQAGNARGDLVGRTVYLPSAGAKLVVVKPSGLSRYCDRNVDWIEVL